MVKSSSLIFVLIFAFIFKLETYSLRLVVVVLLIASGVFLMSYQSTTFLIHGVLLVLFASALAARLAAELCVPLTENTPRAQMLFAQAEAELRAARLAGSQQATPRAIEHFPLIAGRR